MQSRRVVFLSFLVSFFFSCSLIAAFFDSTVVSASVTDRVTVARWSPDGNYLALATMYDAGGSTGFVAVYGWDGQSLDTFSGSAKVNFTESYLYGKNMSWSPDGRFFVVTTSTKGPTPPSNWYTYIYEWDPSSSTLTKVDQKVHATDAYFAAAWSRDGQYVLVSSDANPDWIAYSWDSDTKQLSGSAVWTFGSSGRDPHSADFSPDGKYFVVGQRDFNGGVGHIGVFSTDFPSPVFKSASSASTTLEPYSVRWSPDGSHIAVGTSGASVRVYSWDSETETIGASYTQFSVPSYGYDISWSSSGRYLAVATFLGDCVVVYDVSELNKVQEVARYSFADQCESAHWSPLGEYLVVGYDDTNTLSIYTRDNLVDGVSGLLSYSHSYPFNSGGFVVGDVHFTNGFSVGAGQEVEINVLNVVQGTIDLNGTGRLSLDNDLYFGSHITGGTIAGYGNTLFLERNLTTTPDVKLTVTYDLVIDGQGHDIELARWARLFIEHNTTLTLRNVTLRNVINDQNKPPIQFADDTGKLALYNVKIACVDDFYFDIGQLFIHDDVVITGTSRFIYKSPRECCIAPSSTLHIEPNVTFFYDTDLSVDSVNNQLIIMQGDNSALYLNGCTLQISNTGLRLTKGQLYFDNHVTLSNRTTPPPGLDRGFLWGDSASGASQDLDIFVLSGARVDVQGTVFYDCV